MLNVASCGQTRDLWISRHFEQTERADVTGYDLLRARTAHHIDGCGFPRICPLMANCYPVTTTERGCRSGVDANADSRRAGVSGTQGDGWCQLAPAARSSPIS
jgi:hypothetical protein